MPIFEPIKFAIRLMKLYNWQQKGWPHFKYSLDSVNEILLSFSEKLGRVSGILESLPSETQQNILVDIMLAEAIKTSAIEGEFPNRIDVLSSIKKNLGLHTDRNVHDRSSKGLADLMIDVRKTYRDLLTVDKLFAWHKMLMGTNKKIRIATWRVHKAPMQVVSGTIGNENIHFQAPPSSKVPGEMNKFIKWFNETAPGGKHEIKRAPVRSAIAHLYFESIHPFEDGNGRVGRAIAEKALSQTLGHPVMLSLSRTIESNKKLYYKSLEQAQRSNEVTPWIEYFLTTTLNAQIDAETQVDFSLKKVKLFDRLKGRLNDRQLSVIQRMLEEGPTGFEGGMNARKYMGISKTSKATATRDIQHLMEIGVFTPLPGRGRSSSYTLDLV